MDYTPATQVRRRLRASGRRELIAAYLKWNIDNLSDSSCSTIIPGSDPQVCDNHRGISLLSIAGKLLARVLLNRLNEHLEQSVLLPESQCGFRKDRGTTEMIFTARQLQEKCQEQNMDLYATFVDLTKEFDTVSREGLWKIMTKFGCPTKFIAMVMQFHDGMLARIQNDGEFSDPFPVTNGVKQSCVLAPTLFSMMFSAMLTDAFQDGDNGIPIRYRFDGKLFNLRRLQAKSKVQTKVLDEFLFADDMAKGAPTEEKMQKGVDQVTLVTAMTSQSASKRPRWFINQHMASLIRSSPFQ